MTDKIISLDIGSSALRAIEAEVRNNEPKITKIFSMPIPGRIVEAGKILDEKSLSDEIARLWKTAKLTAKNVILSVGGSALQMRIVNDMLWAPEKDFKNMLQYELRDRTPLDVDDYYFDSHTLAEYRNPEDLMIYKRIFLTAADKDYVDTLVRILEGNKLKVVAIDAVPLALIRAHHIAYDYKPNTTVASIDIGAESFTIAFHKNHQPLHQHIDVGSGGNAVTERIARELKITAGEAELLKTTSGYKLAEVEHLTTVVQLPGGHVRTARVKDFTKEQLKEVETIVAEEVTKLITHLNDILDDFFATGNETSIEQFVLSGGGIMLHNFIPRVASELKKPLIAKPFGDESNRKVSDDIFNNQHKFMITLGALVSRDEY